MDLPHLIVAHLMVATRDGSVLLTQRSLKVAYHPGTWSCSIEEQLSSDDLEGGENEAMGHWISRALKEELGLTGAEAHDSDARVQAVFLEGDILNVGVAVLVTVPLDEKALDKTIRYRPRKDYEFADWKFIRWSNLASSLINPNLPLHPSRTL